jgi:rubredoxin
MRQIDVPTPTMEEPFRYYCPICGIELAKSNYETFDKDYFCPYCSTQQRASRVPARSG